MPLEGALWQALGLPNSSAEFERTSSGIMAQEQALVAGVLDRAVAVTLLENFVTHDIRPIEAARTKDEACDSCCKNPAAGFGIAERQSGLKAQP